MLEDEGVFVLARSVRLRFDFARWLYCSRSRLLDSVQTLSLFLLISLLVV